MNHHLIIGVIIIVQAWFILTEDEVGLKADYIIKEATELVDL